MTEKNNRQRVVVIAPGRGCYNKSELGYLNRYHHDKIDLIDTIDRYRIKQQQTSIVELDNAKKYSFKLHTPGENASALIHACALGDFLDIDQSRFEVVAVTGNSMGWYIAMVCAGALNQQSGIEVINTMGSMMSDGLIGGQLIYPVINENWHIEQQQLDLVEQVIDNVNQQEGCELYLSIKLGGYRVLAGNEAGLTLASELLPEIDNRYPMRLYNHGAFHSPLMADISQQGMELLPPHLFTAPQIPLIDGRGHLWYPLTTESNALRQYTLAEQVLKPYDYSCAVQVAVKEFAPDKVIVLGPGNTLGGATAQSLIDIDWFSWGNKAEFSSAQQHQPQLIAMGDETQRALVTHSN
ncbi:ACP S-malonyltransferase [Shewanella waksmanii]|uniref:ACP S-malonyltransferase n=1 Tax=Shewanella waksmanii TaxID=213783 RepID=UPI003736E1B4